MGGKLEPEKYSKAFFFLVIRQSVFDKLKDKESGEEVFVGNRD